MNSVGLLCNCSMTGDPKEELSASLINRTFLIDRALQPSGISLFVYSPREVTSAQAVPGYIVDGENLVAATRPVPRVNANWTYGTRKLLNQGMGYNRFKRWAREHQIGIYVPYEFSEVVSNKRKAYEIVRQHDPALHPRTEDYTGSLVQVRSFLERGDTVFIKPRAGNRGNEIFVLRAAPGGFALTYYDQGARRLFAPVSLEAAMDVIRAGTGEKSYVIQEGVESLRFEDSVFDIRVVMVHDGTTWHSILETRLAPRDSDLSNVFQGGSIRVTETVLAGLFDKHAALEVEQTVRRTAHGVAEHLESLYPTELMEIGFDFLLDRQRRLRLVEVNAKPGVAGLGSETKLFDWDPVDERHYRRWVYPHVAHVAAFLRTKVERLSLSGT